MKNFFLIIFLIFPSIVFGNVYYCVEEKSTGYNVSKSHEITNFKTRKFKIKIDFINYNIHVKKFYFEPRIPSECLFSDISNTMYCLNSIGQSFSINKKTLKFVRSINYINPKFDDDNLISYGYCEKF